MIEAFKSSLAVTIGTFGATIAYGCPYDFAIGALIGTCIIGVAALMHAALKRN